MIILMKTQNSDIIFMKTKVTSSNAEKIIEDLKKPKYLKFHLKVFPEEYRVNVQLETISSSNRFIHYSTKDNINRVSWIGTSIHEYLHQHIQKQLLNQVGPSTYEQLQYIIIGDLNDFQPQMKKNMLAKVAQLGTQNLITLFKTKVRLT